VRDAETVLEAISDRCQTYTMRLYYESGAKPYGTRPFVITEGRWWSHGQESGHGATVA